MADAKPAGDAKPADAAKPKEAPKQDAAAAAADALLSANQKRFKPLKAKLSKVLESNPLDFENPPTEQEKDKPHPMCWVPEHNPKEPDEANPLGKNSIALLQ